MKHDDIRDAVVEANRFLARYIEYAETAVTQTYGAGTADEIVIERAGAKESGALRRASLDLTRALSKMRRAG